MKKINIYYNIVLLFLMGMVPVLGAEKNWFSEKVDNFTMKISDLTKNMLSRHTYVAGSFEHFKDMGTLLFVPKPCAQHILYQQRKNMLNFLQENEANALEGIKNEFNFDDAEWETINTTIQTESEFNLKAMRQKAKTKAYRDSSLPSPWVEALKRECDRHNLDNENVDFNVIDNSRAIANAFQKRPNVLLNIYYNARVRLSTNWIRNNNSSSKLLNFVAAHEIMHTVKGDSIAKEVIQNGLIDKSETVNDLRNKYKAVQNKYGSFSNWLWGEYSQDQFIKDLNHVNEDLKKEDAKIREVCDNSCAYKKWKAAQEKTADTTIACIDPEIAQAAAYVAQKHLHGYTENRNDMRVINMNWEIAQLTEKLEKWRNWF